MLAFSTVSTGNVIFLFSTRTLFARCKKGPGGVTVRVYLYLYPCSLADVDPPQTVEAVWVRLGKARRQYCTATFGQIATAGN